MKSLLTSAIIIVLLVFIAWPYSNLYFLNEALMSNDDAEMSKWIDLKSVQIQYKQDLNNNINSSIPGGTNAFTSFLKDGMKSLGDAGVENGINNQWIRNLFLNIKQKDQAPESLFDRMAFAFFEDMNQFQVRLGELGKSPTHFIMQRQDKIWRVTKIFN